MAESTYGVRAVANAVAELAYRYAEENWPAIRTGDQRRSFAWDALREKQKLKMIRYAHEALNLMPPRERFEEIDRLSDAWKARNGAETNSQNGS